MVNLTIDALAIQTGMSIKVFLYIVCALIILVSLFLGFKEMFDEPE